MANQEHLGILKQGVKVWNGWRNANPNIRINISEADLRDAYLTRVDLRRADLTRADLSGAVLRGADLRDADLSRADLSDTYLGDANLNSASLNSANLRAADVGRADLSGADLSGARFGYTILGRVDLSMVKGLDRAIHVAPSTIGIDTIYQSNANIPEVFLRGSGVPETFIEYMRSLVVKPIDYYSCFISYSHADKSFARRVHDTLQGQGIRCWLDEHQMLPGDDIYEAIDQGIRLWDKVLLCVT